MLLVAHPSKQFTVGFEGGVARASDVNNQEWKLLQLYNFEWFVSKAGIN